VIRTEFPKVAVEVWCNLGSVPVALQKCIKIWLHRSYLPTFCPNVARYMPIVWKQCCRLDFSCQIYCKRINYKSTRTSPVAQQTTMWQDRGLLESIAQKHSQKQPFTSSRLIKPFGTIALPWYVGLYWNWLSKPWINDNVATFSLHFKGRLVYWRGGEKPLDIWKIVMIHGRNIGGAKWQYNISLVYFNANRCFNPNN